MKNTKKLKQKKKVKRFFKLVKFKKFVEFKKFLDIKIFKVFIFCLYNFLNIFKFFHGKISSNRSKR